MDGIRASKRPASSTPDNKEADNKEADNKETETKKCVDESKSKIRQLPPEIVVTILSNLGHRDLVACRQVCTQWKHHVDNLHLQARAFYRRCHPTAYAASLLKPVECYRSLIRNNLSGFGDEGKASIKQLDSLLGHQYFPKVLFFTIARVLTRTKAFICKPITTIQHSSWVINADFSPDGHHLVTVSIDNTAKILGLVNGQWQEKATIQHSGRVDNASFSLDG
uniref:F-box/WD repeat-containing protein n=1 Tax=Parendozoicomonas sp. Alg238-R29 TaxID=2993446 RepID=UPI00248DCD4E